MGTDTEVQAHTENVLLFVSSGHEDFKLLLSYTYTYTLTLTLSHCINISCTVSAALITQYSLLFKETTQSIHA